MPTSVTGTSTSNPRARGFTLIELLVVVLIIGITLSVALLTVRGGGEARLAQDEIHRLERLVGLAADESVYRLIELGLEIARDGYRFLVWDGTEWIPLPEPGPLREHHWPDALAPLLTVEAKPIAVPPRFDADEPVPQIVFLSSGEVSAFTLELVAPGGVGERLQVFITAETEREPIGQAP